MKRINFKTSRGAVSVCFWKGPKNAPVLHWAHANGFNGQTYATLLNKLKSRFNIYAWDAPGYGKTKIGENYNSKNLTDYWGKNGNQTKVLKALPVSDYPLVAFQGVGEESFTHLHLSIQKDQPFKSKGGVNNELTIDLSKPSSIPPQWLKNHRNNGLDIAVQDRDNMLYLFSNTGKLFWKKKLDGKIIGAIQQVDLYKNKRLQIAFRTQKSFMILDRNGNIVKPFNIKLPKNEHPLPLAIFDYDNNRNYR